MPQTPKDFSQMELVINWNENPMSYTGQCHSCRAPVEENVRPNKRAAQVIYSTVSTGLPTGDYSVYIGKVIHKIYVNKYRQVVFCLRNPEPGDLSEENLNRKPLTADQKIPEPENPESIMEPTSSQDILLMRKKLAEAKQKIREIYGDQ